MIPEILTLLLPVGKYILASTLMVLFYLLFYRGKTSYDLSRKYLVSIALVAILLSQFHIIVRTPPVKIVKVEAAGNITSPVLTTNFPQAAQSVSQKSQEVHSLKTKLMDFLTVPNILFLIYGLVTLILIVSFILQYFKIIAMKRKGVVRESDGFEIVESADIPTPFSFCKTIFVGQNLTGNKRDVVIKHEQWHIRHHHYVDVMVMESLVRLFWFNPVLWWVRKELRNISEFQTDRSVLDEGHELYKYQTIILEEVMEQNPYLANGFNNSFTKKRFIRMKNTIQVRFTTLRRAILLPFMISVFCLLCFTEGKGETRYVLDEPVIQNASDSKSMDVKLVKAIDVPYMELKIDEAAIPDSKDIDQVLEKVSTNLGLAIDELSMAIKATNKQSRIQSLQKVFTHIDVKFKGGQMPISESLCESISDNELIQARAHFIEFKKETDVLKKEPDKTTKAQKFLPLAMKVLQEPLVTKLLESQMAGAADMMKNVMEPMAKAMTPMLNTMTRMSENKALQTPEVDEDVEGEAIASRFTLTPDKVNLSFVSYQANPQLVSIVPGKNQTRVTLAIPVRNEETWFKIDEKFSIIDTKTHDRYILRGFENGWPIGQEIYLSGYLQKMIDVTLLFPPLKSGVEVIDILDYTESAMLAKAASRPWSFRNVKIAKYRDKKPDSAVYK